MRLGSLPDCQSRSSSEETKASFVERSAEVRTVAEARASTRGTAMVDTFAPVSSYFGSHLFPPSGACRDSGADFGYVGKWGPPLAE